MNYEEAEYPSAALIALRTEEAEVLDKIESLGDYLQMDNKLRVMSESYRAVVLEQYRSLMCYHIALQERILMHEKAIKKGAE